VPRYEVEYAVINYETMTVDSEDDIGAEEICTKNAWYLFPTADEVRVETVEILEGELD